jgi:regulator of replication initiation timing
MTSKIDLLKRERDEQRKLVDHWKLQHDEHKRLNNKLLDRVEDLKAEVSRLTAENDFLADDRDGYVQLLTDQNACLTAENEKLKAALAAGRDW